MRRGPFCWIIPMALFSHGPCVNVLYVLSYHKMQNVYTVMFEGKFHYMIHLPMVISPQHKWLFP